MKNKIINASTIGITLTILFSIFPLTQIILFTLNGGLTYLFAIPFDTSKTYTVTISSVTVNAVLVVIGIIGYYFARKTWLKILTVFLIMFSGQMLVLHRCDQFNGDDNYLLGWLAVSGIPILVVLTTGIAKHYYQDTEKIETQT